MPTIREVGTTLVIAFVLALVVSYVWSGIAGGTWMPSWAQVWQPILLRSLKLTPVLLGGIILLAMGYIVYEFAKEESGEAEDYA